MRSSTTVEHGDGRVVPSEALSSLAIVVPHQQHTADSRSSSLPPSEKPVDDHANEPNWPPGIRPYITLFGCFLLMFNSWGLVNAYGTYQSYYKAHLFSDRDLLLLNLIGSTESFVVLILSFVIGRLLDAGYYRYLTATGAVLVSLAMFMLGVGNPYEMEYNQSSTRDQGNYVNTWLTQGFVLGLGMACFFVSSSQIAATWFVKRKSFAIGIVASGASIAGLVYPIMTKLLLEELGFTRTVYAVAGLVTALTIVSCLCAVPNPAFERRRPETWMSKRVWIDSKAFNNKSYSWFVASIALMFFGFYCVFFNLEEWATDMRLGYKGRAPPTDQIGPQEGAVATFYLLAIMNGCSTLGRLGSAYLSDHYGALNVHAVVSFVAALLCLILWTLAANVASAIAFVVIFGAVSGAVIGLPPASVAYILGPTKEAQRKLGQWTGMMYTVAAPFALTGPVIAGHLISTYERDWNGTVIKDYRTVQLWAGACLLLSAFCQMASIYCRKSSQEKENASDYGIKIRQWATNASERVLNIIPPSIRRNGSSGNSSDSDDEKSKA